MVKVWNRLSVIFAAVFVLAVQSSALGQEATFRLRKVIRTEKNGRSVSGTERVAVVRAQGTQAGSSLATGTSTVPQGKQAPTGLASKTRVTPAGTMPNNVTISSNAFGSVAVGSSTTVNLTFGNVSGGLTFTSGPGTDYSISSVNCGVSCSVAVVFSPQYPGLRNSAVTATTSSGTVVDEAFVYGTGTGPQLGFELGYETTFTGNFSSLIQQPAGVTLGPDRAAYFTDAGSKQVYTINRYDSNNPYGLNALPITGLASPSGIAVDGNNTVYVADKTNNVIVSYTAAGVQGTVTTTPLSGPMGLAVDGVGALYIADTGNGRVIRIDTSGTETTLASSLTSPEGITVDSAGDVFFNNNDSTSGGTIMELPAGGGTALHFGSGLGTVQALTVDAGGTLYYSTSTELGLITTAGGLTINNYGNNGPTGIAVAPNGDLYTALPMAEFDTTDRSSGNFIVNAPVGGSAQGGLTIRNLGNTSLTLSNVGVSEDVYSIDPVSDCMDGSVLSPASTCGITVDYNPNTPGADQQTVDVTTNSLNVNGSAYHFILYGYAGQTGTTLAASAASVSMGQPVTLTAMVSSQDGSNAAPTGVVDFVDGDSTIGEVTLAPTASSSSSLATFTTSSLAVGQHMIEAIYEGSGSLATSTSDPQAVTVTGGTTTMTTLAVSAAGISTGGSETLTATIAGGSGPTLTGSVTFFDQNGMLGSTTVTSSSMGGSAALTVTTLSTGSHSIYAFYGGDTNYASSTSGTSTVTVGGSSAIVQSQNFGSTPVGTPVSMTITLTGATSGLIQATFSQDFTLSNAGCYTTCTATVTFNPLYPGLRTDTVTFSDGNGNVYERVYLYGVGTGPQLGFDPGLSILYQGFATTPKGVAIGADDTRFFTDAGTNQLRVLTSTGTSTPTIAGLGAPSGVAVDGNDTVYIADQTNNVIVTYGYKSQVQGSVATPLSLSGPTGLAVDGTGALYIADTGNNRILKVDNQGSTTTVAGELSSPTWIALDAAGDLYYTDSNNAGEIVELPAGGGDPISIGRSIGTVRGLAVDASNRVYYTSYSGLEIISPSRGFSPYTIQGLTGALDGVGVGRAGDVVVAQGSSSQVDISMRSMMNYYLTENVGATGSDTFLISNTGNAPLTLSSEAISGSAWTIDPSSQCVDGTVVAAAGTCSVKVNFTPTAAQMYPATLTATSNSLNVAGSTDTYSLFGTGAGAGTTATTTTLSVSPATVNSGTAETLTAMIQAGTSPAITGTVTFYDQNGAIGSGTVVATSTGGTATLAVTSLSVGGHQIYALYNGDGSYGQSTSATQTVTVVQQSTTTALAVSAVTVVAGQAETLTATVQASGTPALTQTVTFYQSTGSGSSALGTASVTATSTGGTVSLTLTNLSAGSHGIFATYSGDNNYTASTSGTQTVTVTAATTGTTTSLAVDRSSVVYRTPVAFTASVATTAGTPVTVGQVIFCDVAATYCTRDQNLAIAQLNTNGVAVTRMAAGVVGNHAFRAVFLGTSTVTGSASGSQNVVVTAPSSYADFTTIASTGSVGNYSLTASVTGLSTRLLAPSGTVTFNDTTNTSNPVLGTATLGAATLGFLALQPSGSPVSVGSHPYGVATGDFNGDGYPDVVTENYNGASVSVLLGMGNGSFQPAVNYAVGSLPERVLVADFNGDGNLDLVVANTGSGTVSVLLGNGDGTFQTQVTYGCSSPVGLGVMDLNHDGFADIVAGDYYGNTISVLLGNGDGTFRSAVTYRTGGTPQTLAEGDFNGDGNVDVAVGNESGATVGILLGNGDGTFQPQVTYAVGNAPQGVQVGDFNRDGFEDLAVSNQTDGTISVLLGNGDGTFRPQVTYAVGGQPVGLVVADFNGDGYQDLSVGNTAQSSLTQSILLGNGDGTFQAQMTYPTGNFPYGEAVADFDGNGFPDLVIANFSDSTATVLLSYPTQTATATLTGVSPTGAAGTHNVDASFPGDGNFGAYTSSTIPLTVASPAAAVTATSLAIRPAAVSFGQSVGFFVGVAGTTQTSLVPTGMVTLMNVSASPATVLGVITLDTSGSGSLSTTSLAPGSYSVTAVYSGDGTYAASTSAAQTLTVSQASTTTALTLSSVSVTVGQSETLSVTVQGSATGALSGTVTFLDGTTVLGSVAITPSTSTASNASAMASLILSSLGVGSHSIVARYGGDTNDAGSLSAAQTVTVTQATAPVSLGVSAASLTVGQTETLTATLQHAGTPALTGTVTFFDGTALLGTSAVTATSAGGSAALAVSTLAVGTHSITARYSGDTNFAATVSAAQTVAVSSASTTTSLAVSGGSINVNQTETLTATIAGGANPALSGTVTFFDGTTTVGTATVTATSTGGTASVTLTTLTVATHQYSARYGGDANYSASASGAQAVVVSLVAQTITFPAIPNHVIGDVAFALNATASSGLAVSYSLVSGPATISGSSVTVTGAGTVVIQASQAGNTTYAAATQVTQSFAVTLQPVVTLGAVSPASVVTGTTATTVTLTGTNFAARDVVQLNGTAIASTFVNATTLTAVIPASFRQAAGAGQITVVDPQNSTPSGAVTFTVASIPAVVFSGPSSSTSAQQPALTLQLVNPYPTAITGTLTLTFAPTSATGVDDPAVQFATGGRTLTFTIAANSTTTPAVLLQTGTVAGLATATLVLTSNGLNVTPATAAPVVITITTAVPSITTAAVTRATNTLTVTVHGFSNTREITTAVFHFVAASGSTIATPDITVNVGTEFAQWYGSTASTQYGSSFTYTQQFTLDQDVSSVGSVTVTLMNTVGTSAVDTAQ